MAFFKNLPANLNHESPAKFEAITYAKVSWRLLPVLMLAYIGAYLDRINVGFAKLQMLADLKFSEEVYGLGAGVFFLGYFLFEIPSNLVLQRVGARVWIARIMLSWGIISALTIWITSPLEFYCMRFLLGVAEAGFFPGVILYLTYWYPSQRRGKIYAQFMTAVALAGVVGGPLSGWILSTWDQIWGLHGWQWVLLLEALPSCAFGLFLFFYLDDGINQAKWLTSTQKLLLQANLDQDNQHATHSQFKAILLNWRVWLLGGIYFCFSAGLYGVGFWLPSIIKNMGIHNPLQIGVLVAFPYACAVIAMLLLGWSSDRKLERRWHLAITAAIGGVSFCCASMLAQHFVYAMLALTLATMSIMSVLPLFWSIPTAFLASSAAAGGIAMINSLGNLSGFLSPAIFAYLQTQTHSMHSSILFLATSMLCAALAVLLIPARLINGLISRALD